MSMMPAARPIGVTSPFVQYTDPRVTTLNEYGDSTETSLFRALWKVDSIRKSLHDRMRAACASAEEKDLFKLQEDLASFKNQFQVLMTLNSEACAVAFQLEEDMSSGHLQIDGLQLKDLEDKRRFLVREQAKLNRHLNGNTLVCNLTHHTLKKFESIVRERAALEESYVLINPEVE